jgi:MipA family protein
LSPGQAYRTTALTSGRLPGAELPPTHVLLPTRTPLKTPTLRFTRIALTLGSMLAAPMAMALTFDAVRLDAAPPGQDGGTAGPVVFTDTAYQGSDERRTRVLPMPDYQWANGWFAGLSNGVGINFSQSAKTQYGLRVTADMGRKAGRSTALRGMGEVGAKPEVGAFFNLALNPGWSLSSSLRLGSGQGGKGLLIDLGAGYSTAIAAPWRIGAGAALTAVNADRAQSYFGVTAAQSARSGYAVYTPKAGLRDVRTSLWLSYALNLRTRITGAVAASSLVGDARNSPLTKQTTTATGELAVSVAF